MEPDEPACPKCGLIHSLVLDDGGSVFCFVCWKYSDAKHLVTDLLARGCDVHSIARAALEQRAEGDDAA